MRIRSRLRTFFNRGDQMWAQDQDAGLSIDKVIDKYKRGMAGCWSDGEGEEKFRGFAKRTSGADNYADLAHANNTADSHAGKLVLPWLYAEELFPGCWPGPGQERGDCVCHSLRTCVFGTMCGEIVAGVPDEFSKLLEGVPELTRTAILNLVLSCESNWWWRGYNGDGWYLADALEKAFENGILLRKDYPELGINLEEYSYSNSAKYGSRSPSDAIAAESRLHLLTSAVNLDSFEEIRDALGNLHGVGSDGGEAWSSQRDANGFSKQSGRWSHSFPFIGADDRPIAKQKYGESLILMMNNWAVWNGGPRDIMESAALVTPEMRAKWTALGILDRIVNKATGNIMIPQGSWWALASSARNRETKASAGFRGWAAKALPDWGTVAI